MNGIIKKNPDNTYEFGEFPHTQDTISIFKRHGSLQNPVYCKHLGIVKDDVFFSLLKGVYFWKSGFTPKEIKKHTTVMGVGLYPYTFDRAYEAVNHFSLFSGKEIVENAFVYLGSRQLKYTFGLEYETSMGSIPEWRCFHDGLIPLRDGSINGAEYSSIVMAGNSGINLIQQQLNTLKSHTAFNKECALHIHFGGYPVNRKAIFTLYSLCAILENQLFSMCNRFVVETSKYKKSGKDYCLPLNEYDTFEDMYNDLVGKDFNGSLNDPHPSDESRNHKWQIRSRYHDINFINMLCYDSPKTVEFRFLRPTYNFTKIYTWILIFNAILVYAELLSKKYAEANPSDLHQKLSEAGMASDIKDIIRYVYDSSVSKIVLENINNLEMVSVLQESNEDYAGSDTSFENALMTDSYRE